MSHIWTTLKRMCPNMGATMKNLEVQIGRMATSLKRKLPSDIEVNLKEHCKAITLRSEKQVGESVPTKENISTPNKEDKQIVVEQENQGEGIQKAHKPYSILFPDNLPILKPALP